ncbi:unnamed protein product [Tilletia laevis]|nr:unnamed protein product [Tilletia laevis]CAD7064621.1 unnamed protein product [Tilletia caries]
MGAISSIEWSMFFRSWSALMLAAEPSHEEDPVAAATQTLLDFDSDDLEPDQVANLIGYFASNIGAAQAYVTLAASQKPGAEATDTFCPSGPKTFSPLSYYC